MARVWKARKGHTFAGSNPALSAWASLAAIGPMTMSVNLPFGQIHALKAPMG